MTDQYSRRLTLTGMAGIVALLAPGACSSSGDIGEASIAGKEPDGTIEMRQVQVAYIGSAGGGSGTLNFRGATYPFRIGGIGIGGLGASSIDAVGEVYNLPDLARFPGAYAQARYGFAIGRTSGGDMWLQNEAGVILHLKAKREGLMLSLGGDAIMISMQ
jgi:hypothetical protein